MAHDGQTREPGPKAASSPAEIEEAARALTAAFVEDPIFAWFFRADAGREAARLRFFRMVLTEVAFPDGEIMRPESGGAAAVWIPSNKLSGQPATRELRALPMLLGAAGIARFGRLLTLRKAMDAHHPMDRPHDYLWFLGVRPELQGSGMGSKLLTERTERLDALGRCGFLETATPRNLSLYQRHGFEIVSEYRPRADGPLIWGMWREPRS